MYAQAAGMPNPRLMAAIAMAESGGRTTAHNPLPPDDSYGLWQINMIGSLGPSRRAQFGIARNADLFDPAVNARAAAKILASQGLSAWSTYTGGSYKRYMGVSSAGGATPVLDADDFDPFGLVPDVQGLTDVADGIAGIAEGVQKAGAWISDVKSWVRVGYVAGGVVLVVVGAYIVAAPMVGKVAASSPLGQTVKAVAGKSRGGSKAPAKRESSDE